MDKDELKKKLSPIEYYVTQEKGTEKPFTGKFNDFFDQGVYNCVVCESPLFDSEDKFKSQCGWPAFSKESVKESINYTEDNSYGMQRVEITCKKCDAHLGHVFKNEPSPTGIRYCVNSAALKFAKKMVNKII